MSAGDPDREAIAVHVPPELPALTTRGSQDPGAVSAGREDRAYHLARVCARFPRTISTEGAKRLARLLRPEADQ